MATNKVVKIKNQLNPSDLTIKHPSNAEIAQVLEHSALYMLKEETNTHPNSHSSATAWLMNSDSGDHDHYRRGRGRRRAAEEEDEQQPKEVSGIVEIGLKS